MNSSEFLRKLSIYFLLSFGLLLLQLPPAFGQLPPEVAEFGYADTIFINGKIVSMDDISNSTEVGNIYQALAVKRDRIMKLGTSAQIRALAGPDTTSYDAGENPDSRYY